MKRLITFGCSFTDYSWPTWADIIALDQDCEYENWAQGGGGNQQIARRALYRHSRGIDYTDTVMIQWTSITREDRWLNNRWVCEGSVATSPTYSKDFFEQYWSWDNDVINTAQARITTEMLLAPWLKYQCAMTWNDGDHLLSDRKDITEYWSSRLTEVDLLPNGVRGIGTGDGHPDPRWWMNWVETKIYPKLNLTLKASTRQRVWAMQRYLLDLVNKKCPHKELQQLARDYCVKHQWRLNKVKPGSDTLTPGQGSDILI
jgi:hypothetical protein